MCLYRPGEFDAGLDFIRLDTDQAEPGGQNIGQGSGPEHVRQADLVDRELYVKKGFYIAAFKGADGAWSASELNGVDDQEVVITFDVREQIQPQRAAIKESKPFGKYIPLPKGRNCMNANPLIPEEQVAYAKDKGLDFIPTPCR